MYSPKTATEGSPWASRQVWSLWEMLDVYGFKFANAIIALSEAKLLCFPVPLKDDEKPLTNPQIAVAVLHGVRLMRQACLATDMLDSLPELKRLENMMSPIVGFPFPDRMGVAQAIVHLLSRIQDELSREYFVRIEKDGVRLWHQKQPFGADVAAMFADASNDIETAGKCLAVGQGTACVFHLMRAIEVAVRRLSRRLNVTITPQTTWRQMTGSMDGKIKAMPEKTNGQKHRKHEWEAARANLHHVGSVWRNNTMHPAQSYSQSQAKDIYAAVRVFMNALAKLLPASRRA